MPIRSWVEGDLGRIAALLEELNEALGEDQDRDLDLIRAQYRHMIEQKDVYENYVLEEGGQVQGFASMLFYRSVYHKKGTAQINELIVSKAHRNKGIGRELLNFCMKRALELGMDEIEVGVMKDNTEAIEFYKRNGMDEEYLLLGKEFG